MFSAQCKYAIRAASELARREADSPCIGSELLSQTLNIPKPFLSKVLQKMVRMDLISSIKGPNGGFYLSEANRKESVSSFLNKLNCSQTLDECVLGQEQCSTKDQCAIHKMYEPLMNAFLKNLSKMSINDLGEKNLVL